MSPLLSLLGQRCQADWLIGYDCNQFYRAVEAYRTQFQKLVQHYQTDKLLLNEREPWPFLALLLGAIAADCSPFIANPDWQTQEWQQVSQFLTPVEKDDPVLMLGTQTYQFLVPFPKNTTIPSNSILIPTGGSSGKIRFAIHNWQTLSESVRGFQEYFQEEVVNSFCLLPLHHVGGLMQFIRSLLSAGKFVQLTFSDFKAGKRIKIQPESYYLSLVPTQLYYLLDNASDWLAQFKTVFLGGAAASPSLLKRARHHRIRLAPTYGMTETAAQIATLKPDDFLKGEQSNGQILPHALVKILDDNGNCLSNHQSGIITIEAKSLFLGYFPNKSYLHRPFRTDDLGYFDQNQALNILGRNNHKIITGGENVFPAEIESAIQNTNLVSDVAIIGVPDAKWGEAIAALCVLRQSTIELSTIQNKLKGKISRYKYPKYWICLNQLPRNALGKLNVRQLQAIALDFVNQEKKQTSVQKSLDA